MSWKWADKAVPCLLPSLKNSSHNFVIISAGLCINYSWYVKNGFSFAFQFFLLIFYSLGGVLYNVTRNLNLYPSFQMDIPRAPINGRGQQATPPPPPRPSQQQLLRCHGGNLANNYQRSTSAPAPATSTPGLPNSYSVVSGIMSK